MRIDTTSALQVFTVEIILVDSFDRILNPGTHADLVDDHEAREFLPVDQDDALRTLGHIVRRGPREPGGSHEHALGRARRIDRPGEIPEVAFTHGGTRSIFRLYLAGDATELTNMCLYFSRESAINLVWPMSGRVRRRTRRTCATS